MRKIVTVKELFSRIPQLEQKTLLDIGTGPNLGYSAVYLQAISERGKDPEKFRRNIYTIDIKKPNLPIDNMLEMFIQADAKDLPLENDFFDIVALGNLLHLFSDSDQEQIMKETYRVLRPKGYLIGKAKLPIFLKGAQVKKYETMIEEHFSFLEKGTTSYVDSWNPLGKAFYFLTQRL